MVQSNVITSTGSLFRKLSDDQREQTHNASLEILETTGARLYEQEALDLLRRAGAHVSDGNRVRIPALLVEWSLSTAPGLNRQPGLTQSLG